MEAEKSRAVELRVAVAESFRSEERGGGGEGGSVGGGGGGEGGGEGGGKGDGGGDGGCSRGTAHQVGRLRALWQRTVWLVGKDCNGDERVKRVLRMHGGGWRENSEKARVRKHEW